VPSMRLNALFSSICRLGWLHTNAEMPAQYGWSSRSVSASTTASPTPSAVAGNRLPSREYGEEGGDGNNHPAQPAHLGGR
jgi:hypothetical protein